MFFQQIDDLRTRSFCFAIGIRSVSVPCLIATVTDSNVEQYSDFCQYSITNGFIGGLRMKFLSQAIGLYFMPVISFIFMYYFISAIAPKEHNHLHKVISSISFAIIAWTITNLMMLN